MPVNEELLSDLLRHLKMSYDTKSVRDAVETLLKIFRNILHNEEVLQYRVIKPSNSTFAKKVWNLYPCRRFMLLSGWIEVNDQLVFNSDENLVEVINILLEHRDIAPRVHEWDESSKYDHTIDRQIKEEQLRHKATIEREKALEECLKDKKYREELAKEIKAQVAADKKQRALSKPVVDKKIVKNTNIKTLYN